jgi:glucose uptake protein GlcU
MEPTGKIDIKSEVYRAAVPHIIRLSKASYARYQVLPKGDIFKNFAILYLAVGFITEGLAGAIPNMALGMLGISTGLVGFVFFAFWPMISFFILGDQEHTILALAIIFIGATYITHLKQKNVEAFAIVQSLQAAQPRAALTEDRSFVPHISAGAAPIIDQEPMGA